MTPQSINKKPLSAPTLLLLFFLGCTLFASLLSPFIYKLVQSLHNLYPDLPTLKYLSKKPFDDYFDRIRWIPILIGLPWIISRFNLNSFKKFGLSPIRPLARPIARSLLLGFAITLVIASTQILFFSPQLSIHLSLIPLLKLLLSSTLLAFFISFIEESLFRGIILKSLTLNLSQKLSIILSALFFAYTHFKMPSYLWDNSNLDVNLYAGFYVGFWSLFSIIRDFNLPIFLNLTLIGIATGLLFNKTRSLWTPIAFHTGLLIPLFLFKKTISLNITTPNLLLGSTNMNDSYLGLFLLLISIILITTTTYFDAPKSNQNTN